EPAGRLTPPYSRRCAEFGNIAKALARIPTLSDKQLEGMASSDRELIASCLQGEQLAWTELIARYQRLIYSVARGLCPQPEDCADVFQRVCMELYQSLGRIRNDQTLPAWLITVTKRCSYGVLRGKRTTI